jgi:CRP-like cAMP-binding protein
MARQTASQGETLFHRNTPADRLYVLKSGCLYLPELNRWLGPGQVLADAGLWEANGLRSSTAICETDCELRYMTRQKLFGSAYRQRQIAFLIMRGLYEICSAPKFARSPRHTSVFGLNADPLNAYR